MKATTKLKDQARFHEQREEWEKAAELYLQVLRAGEESEGDVELPLFNRVGDLYLRLGRPMEAVRYFEEAADRYAEAGLYNSAIALCNKALRHVPDRLQLYRRLGQLSLQQGFLSDARRWFLDYAERQLKRGALDEAFAAISDLADLSNDPAIRELLGRQLAAHDRPADAIRELSRAYRLRMDAGQTDEAAQLRQEILVIDPAAADGLDRAEGAQEAASADAVALDEDGLAIEDGLVDVSATFEVDADAGEPIELMNSASSAGLEPAAQELSDEIVLDPGLTLQSIAEDLDSSSRGEEPGVELGSLEGLEATSAAIGEPDAAEVEPLPGAELFAELEPLVSLGADDAPASGLELDEPASPYGDLPMLEIPGEESAPLGMFAQQAELEEASPLELAPLDLQSGMPDSDEAVGEPVELDAESLEVSADEIELSAESFELTVEPLAPPAEEEEEAEESAEAEPPVAQPESAAPEAETAEPSPAASAAKPESDFIDLGELLREEEEREVTRFVVAEKPPSGDEEQDFAELLAQFKEKVAENIGEDDPHSHYDLGLAFREMGLYDEAIAELQTALRGGFDQLKAYEEMGNCFMQKGQFKIAEKVFERALELPQRTENELLGMYYLLGRCHEELEQADAARDAYERVVGIDIQFRDAAERLARL